jgi:hypothetical protein
MFLKRAAFTALLLAGLFFILQMQSCRNDDLDLSPDLRLSFNADSLLFDTVFTTIGSSTRYFKVYNRHNSRLNISQIELAGGRNSFFRINVDGRSGTLVRDIEIGPRDSIFVFVEVTVDPTGQELPLVISDSIIFRTNNNVQDVKLVAWGQDAHFIKPNYTDPESGFSFHLILEDAVWAGPKPYVVYGFVLVAPGVTLRIDKGTQVHLHNRSSLVFYPESTLKIQGTLEEPVFIQGDRLEPGYRNLPGQWGYIWLMATSRNHEIEYAVIKNGTYGIIMDSIGSHTEPTLIIRNTIIKNMEQTGLELNGAWVDAANMVVANCGTHAILARWGGNYSFRHITVANYYNLPGSIRQTPSVVINNYYKDTLGVAQIRPIIKAYFANSIIYGSMQDEIMIDFFPDNKSANFSFDHSLLRTTLGNQFASKFENCILNQNPMFKDTGTGDLRLAKESPAIGKGSNAVAAEYPFDMLGNSRNERVDIGAFQFYEEDTRKSRNSLFSF